MKEGCETRVLSNVGIDWICEVVLDASLKLFNCSIMRNSKHTCKCNIIILAAEC